MATNACTTCGAHESTRFEFNVRNATDLNRGKLDLATSAVVTKQAACYESDECSLSPLNNCASRSCEHGDSAMFLDAGKETQDEWEYAAVVHEGRYYHASCLARCERCRVIKRSSDRFFVRACPDAPWKPIRVKRGKRGAHAWCEKCETRCTDCAKECLADCGEHVAVELESGVHKQCHDWLAGCKKPHGFKYGHLAEYAERAGKTVEQVRGSKRPDESEPESAKRVK